MLSKVLDEINYPSRNINGATVEVWEWMSKFIPHIVVDVITYPCCMLEHLALTKLGISNVPF